MSKQINLWMNVPARANVNFKVSDAVAAQIALDFTGQNPEIKEYEVEDYLFVVEQVLPGTLKIQWDLVALCYITEPYGGGIP